jgi:hypothetical protein
LWWNSGDVWNRSCGDVLGNSTGVVVGMYAVAVFEKAV